ncbi:hypothetical protein WN83_14250 [Listeria monocytogenes]|nr:hypothetical protein [Listeria monocytogenes]EAD4868973.1 hypothetical protein [Listeria monocytogenes]
MRKGFLIVNLLLAFGFVLAACGNDNVKQKNTNETEDKKESNEEKKDLDFSFDKTEYETDKDGNVEIKGTVTKGADVTLNNTSIDTDENGNILYRTTLDENVDKLDLNFEAYKEGYESQIITVLLKNNSSSRKDFVTKEQQKKDYEKEHRPQDNTVYGVLVDKYDLTEESEDLFHDESKNVIYTIVENDIIFQASIELGDDSLYDANKDKTYLLDLASSYMQNDAKLVDTISENSFIYKSSKINKKYNVDFVPDNNNKIIVINITNYSKE